MYKNFINVASANIKTSLLNVEENKNQIIKYLTYTGNNNIDIVIFPELTLTGLSGGEMIASKEITNKCNKALSEILNATKSFDTLICLGLPIRSIYGYVSAMIYIKNGKIIKAITKGNTNKNDNLSNFNYVEKNIDNYFFFNNEKYELKTENELITINNINIQLLFESQLLNGISTVNNSTNILLIAGNNNCDMNSLDNISEILKAKSLTNKLGIIFAGASNYESSSNYVYSSQKFIIENGKILEEGKLFNNGLIFTELDTNEFKINHNGNINFDLNLQFKEKEILLKRKIDKYPYFPNKDNYNNKLKNILEIQSEALVRRLRQLPTKKIFLGISGGLDSTLGLIISSLAFHKLGLDSKDIFAITMPGLGTSNRTKNNATELAKAYNVTFKEISIKNSVLQHFKDIEHDENDFSVTYENAQARERTQLLMDLANKYGGMVLGTGNMSEIALGWATYNGDHMSMYSVNSGLPKTLLREVVRYVSQVTSNEIIKKTLTDIIETPISPELLPTNDEGKIAQKTEDNVGPYELHDFFVYHLVRNKATLDEIRFMANNAFKDTYSNDIIEKWFKKFLWRFSTQQFKRNVSPDAPQILDYSLNPKLGFIMPSDIDPQSLK